MKLIDLTQMILEIVKDPITVKKLYDKYGRRVYDVTNILFAAGLITRKKGMVELVQPLIKDPSLVEQIYKSNKLMVSCHGAITSVKNLGDKVLIEQSSQGFTINAVEC